MFDSDVIGCFRCGQNSWTLMAVLGLAGLAGCANPMPPTGGPADETPPGVESIEPADQSVGVTADAMTIVFSEYVDEASFQRAFSITPGFETPPDMSWRGRAVTVHFPEMLRANTTYIVQLDNNLRDAHGVSVRSPITVAFATGPRIDRGMLSGRVVEPRAGHPTVGIDVFAYRDVDSGDVTHLPNAPDYRTQTGTDGAFTFSYLPENTAFYVIALSDGNRNRAADPTERFAAPPMAAILSDTTSAASPSLWVTTLIDTIPPEPRTARVLSSRRVVLRLSEPVELSAQTTWTITDSSGTPTNGAIPYLVDDFSEDVYVLSDSLAPGTYRLVPTALTDTAGNVVRSVPASFQVTPAPDTMRSRFEGFDADTVAGGFVHPRGAPALRFSSGIPENQVRGMLTVSDSVGAEVPYTLATSTRTRWSVASPVLQDVGALVLSVAAPESTFVGRFRSLPFDETGEVSGYVAPAADNTVVELLRPGGQEPYRVRADATGSFIVRRLPEGQYAVRAYVDADSSLSWSGGSIAPYERPEDIGWRPDSVRVRARWETALEDTLWIDPSQNQP